MKTQLRFALEQIVRQSAKIASFTTQYAQEIFVGYNVHRLNDSVLPMWMSPEFFVPELVHITAPTKPHTHWDGPSSFYFLGSGTEYAGGKKKTLNEHIQLWLGVDTGEKISLLPYSPNNQQRFFFIPAGVAHAVDPGTNNNLWFLALHTPPIQGKYSSSRNADDVTHPEFEYILPK